MGTGVGYRPMTIELNLIVLPASDTNIYMTLYMHMSCYHRLRSTTSLC